MVARQISLNPLTLHYACGACGDAQCMITLQRHALILYLYTVYVDLDLIHLHAEMYFGWKNITWQNGNDQKPQDLSTTMV